MGRQLTENLAAEAEEHGARRGIRPNSEMLSFEIYLSEKIRQRYDKKLSQLLGHTTIADEVKSRSTAQRAINKKRTVDKDQMNTYLELKKFFRTLFKDSPSKPEEFRLEFHSKEQYDKPPIGIFNKMTPFYKPEITQLSQTTLFEDPERGYNKMTMYGME